MIPSQHHAGPIIPDSLCDSCSPLKLLFILRQLISARDGRRWLTTLATKLRSLDDLLRLSIMSVPAESIPQESQIQDRDLDGATINEVPIGGDEEAIKDEKAVYDDFPDGGLRAWTVVAGVRAPCLDRGEQR